jgi:murein DD-endopeptidase MepM/ murein hydrolase activator NlpD
MAVEPEPVVQEPLVYPTPMPVPEEALKAADEAPAELQPVAVPRPEPQPEPEPVVEPEPTVPAEPFFVYTVAEGDTVSGLAARYGIKPESIAWNNADVYNQDFLAVGQQIRIPTADGIIHEISYGQTLTDIAMVYDVNVEDIVSFPANDLTSADVVLENQTVFVPNGVMPAPPEPEPAAEEEAPSSEEAPALAESPEAAPAAPQILEAPASSAGYIWPVTGPISSYFGPSHPLGIDIDLYNNAGAPIVAAAGGTVLIAGGDPCCSYGLQVLIQHPDGSETRYGHLGNVEVSVGQAVDQGQVIGRGGCTGYCTGDHLHFEIIIDGHVVDPLLYLP